jgi:hypothetical protein
MTAQKMLTFDQAKKIVTDILSTDNFLQENDSLIIIDDLTIEKPYAWIFTYTSKLWYETKDNKYAIAGNAPIIVDKKTGKRTYYSTEYGIDNIIEKYEEEKKIWCLILVDNKSLDNEKTLLIKNIMNLSYDNLMRIKNGMTTYIESGSQSRLTLLQADLLKTGIETKLTLTWDEE